MPGWSTLVYGFNRLHYSFHCASTSLLNSMYFVLTYFWLDISFTVLRTSWILAVWLWRYIFTCSIWSRCFACSVAGNSGGWCNRFYSIGEYTYIFYLLTMNDTNFPFVWNFLMFKFMNQFPKLMEVVGLGYTFWFSWRYLLFKVAILRVIWAFIFCKHDDHSMLIGLLLSLYRKIEMSWLLKLKNSSSRLLAQMRIDTKEKIGLDLHSRICKRWL